MSRKNLHIWSAIAVAILVTISAAAITSTEAIKERQHAMEGVRDGLMALGAIAKKEKPFDAEVIAFNAAKIEDGLTRAAEFFPEGSDQGEVQTWAKPNIWSDGEHFEELLENARQAAIEMQSVTEADAFPPALGKLGNTCKSCHDMYRLPKN